VNSFGPSGNPLSINLHILYGVIDTSFACIRFWF